MAELSSTSAETTQSMEISTPISSEVTSSDNKAEVVKFTVNYKKQNVEIEFGVDQTLGALRLEIAKLTGVAAGLQKLMYKGMMKDDAKTLRDLNVKDGAKMMLVGSTIGEVLTASAPVPQPTESKAEEETKGEAMSEKLPHKKIVDKGVPEGAEPGKKKENMNLFLKLHYKEFTIMLE